MFIERERSFLPILCIYNLINDHVTKGSVFNVSQELQLNVQLNSPHRTTSRQNLVYKKLNEILSMFYQLLIRAR